MKIAAIWNFCHILYCKLPLGRQDLIKKKKKASEHLDTDIFNSNQNMKPSEEREREHIQVLAMHDVLCNELSYSLMLSGLFPCQRETYCWETLLKKIMIIKLPIWVKRVFDFKRFIDWF